MFGDRTTRHSCRSWDFEGSEEAWHFDHSEGVPSKLDLTTLAPQKTTRHDLVQNENEDEGEEMGAKSGDLKMGGKMIFKKND